MGIRAVTMYRLVCDWPGCEISAQDGSDYYAWADEDGATEEATNGDWHEGCDGRWYCGEHPTTWSSDHEQGEALPEPPYLRIHDGDDAYPEHDDGSVCLIAEVSA